MQITSDGYKLRQSQWANIQQLTISEQQRMALEPAVSVVPDNDPSINITSTRNAHNESVLPSYLECSWPQQPEFTTLDASRNSAPECAVSGVSNIPDGSSDTFSSEFPTSAPTGEETSTTMKSSSSRNRVREGPDCWQDTSSGAEGDDDEVMVQLSYFHDVPSEMLHFSIQVCQATMAGVQHESIIVPVPW